MKRTGVLLLLLLLAVTIGIAACSGGGGDGDDDDDDDDAVDVDFIEVTPSMAVLQTAEDLSFIVNVHWSDGTTSGTAAFQTHELACSASTEDQVFIQIQTFPEFGCLVTGAQPGEATLLVDVTRQNAPEDVVASDTSTILVTDTSG